MPIIDVEIVEAAGTPRGAGLAQVLGNELGRVLGAAPGGVWLRLRWLPADDYAENHSSPRALEHPVFVEVQQRQPPEGARLTSEVMAITDAVARVLQRPPERVHVCYGPAAAGRQAFGGRLVR